MVGREGGLVVISLIVPVAVSTIGCTLGGPNSNFFLLFLHGGTLLLSTATMAVF